MAVGLRDKTDRANAGHAVPLGFPSFDPDVLARAHSLLADRIGRFVQSNERYTVLSGEHDDLFTKSAIADLKKVIEVDSAASTGEVPS